MGATTAAAHPSHPTLLVLAVALADTPRPNIAFSLLLMVRVARAKAARKGRGARRGVRKLSINSESLRAQGLKTFKILKFSREIENFKRATRQPLFFFWGGGEIFNLAWNFLSRLKFSISIENFKRDWKISPPPPPKKKKEGLVGGSLEIFNLAWKFQDLEIVSILGPLS